jgi:hypothetical protein
MRPPQVQAAPTVEGDAAPQAQAVLRLQAIKSERGRRVAVINGRVVRVGDEVDGATVTGIAANSVVILVEGKSSALKLLGQDIKHDSRTTH